MIYYEVLTKKDRECWDIVQAMAGRQLPTVESLERELNMTDFTLDKRLAAIRESWQVIFGITDFDPREVFAGRVTVSDEQLLRYQKYVLDQSLGNKMLMMYLLDEFDLQRYMEESGTSQATAYRVRGEVQAALRRLGLELEKNRLVGSEALIRNLLMTALNYREVDLAPILPVEMISRIDELHGLLQRVYGLRLKPSSDRLLRHCLSVIFVRVKTGHALTTTIPIELGPNEELILEKMPESPYIDATGYRNELCLLRVFLYAFNFMGSVDFADSEYLRKIRVLGDRFDREIVSLFDVEGFSSDRRKELERRLYQVHWRNSLFPIYGKSFGFLELSDWRGMFGHIFQDIDRIYQEAHPVRENFLKGTRERYSLYYDYFFLLTSFASDKEALPPIYLCVDFSQSFLPFDFMEKFFSLMWFSNVVVQDHIDEVTDVYVSDHLCPDESLKEVIWLAPPSYHEMMELIKVLMEQTRRKGRK